MVTIAQKAEEVGLDVFATGEHHNPPFVPSSPTTMLGYIAAQTERLILSTSTTLITTNDPVKIAEDFAMLQHLADGRVDLMMGRGNTGPGLPVVRQGHPRRHPAGGRELRPAAPAVARGRRRLGGPVPHPAAVLHLHAASAGRRAAVRVARLDPQPGDRRAGRLLRRRLLRQPHLLAEGPLHPADRASTASASSTTATARPTRRSSAWAGRCSCAATSQDAVREFRPVLRQRAGLRPRPVAGGVHRADAADRRQPAGGHRPDARRSASTSATTSASCS